MPGRREVLKALAAAAVAGPVWASEGASRPSLELGFSLYGCKTLSLDESLQHCSQAGYESVELALMTEFHADPKRLNASARSELRRQLESRNLKLAGLMENLALLAPEPSHRTNLDRLKAAADLARDLDAKQPPVIETVLGGKPDQWSSVHEAMADRLAQWNEVLADRQVVLAIKPHVSGAMHRPEHALWLIEQVSSPWIRAAYDYSHYRAQELSLEPTLTALLPVTVFIHVKDTRLDNGKFQFLLPGDGDTDYVSYFRQLLASGYQRPVVVEVSGQISNKPGYDPVAAITRSFQSLDRARKAVLSS